jgi:protein TilB
VKGNQKRKEMPVITRALLRKRSEHNEGIISTMEELTLHQEELEGINEVLGSTCRRIKILYLQNNIIPRIENLVHLKELEYLNLALNNIKKIEGLQNCEFLYKVGSRCLLMTIFFYCLFSNLIVSFSWT